MIAVGPAIAPELGEIVSPSNIHNSIFDRVGIFLKRYGPDSLSKEPPLVFGVVFCFINFGSFESQGVDIN